MTKQQLLKELEELPDDAPLDRIAAELERARFVASVDRGLKQADNGQLTPHDEVVARMRKRFQS